MSIQRLTMAQALVKFLDNQYLSVDGVETKFVAGVFTIFGHGNVLGLGQGFPGARRFRQLLSVDIHKTDEPLALLDQATALLEGH